MVDIETIREKSEKLSKDTREEKQWDRGITILELSR